MSLLGACKKIYRTGASGTAKVGKYDIAFELYTQSDIDANVDAIKKGTATKCTFGDADESKVVLVAGDVITIPSEFNLTPVSPKKSLVIMCNSLIIDGTVSMTAKGPNVEPHDWLILGKSDKYGSDANIIIPAYAGNQTAGYTAAVSMYGQKGTDGTNRNCGAGGMGGTNSSEGNTTYFYQNGSGSAFAGGAGSGGTYQRGSASSSLGAAVNTVYPMRGGTYGSNNGYSVYYVHGGTGNPSGSSFYHKTWSGGGSDYGENYQTNGVGGRIVIYCNTFENNGTISSNGTNQRTPGPKPWGDGYLSNGGASGGGAVDVFYNTFGENLDEGTITATGGKTGSFQSGGNGSVTLLQWTIEKVVREERKMFTEENWTYLFNNYVDRLKDDTAL